MTKPKPRNVRIHTRRLTVTGLAGFAHPLKRLLEEGDYSEPEESEQLVNEILQAVGQYRENYASNRTRPSVAKQQADLAELADALAEARERLYPWHIPPDGEPLLVQALLQEHDIDLISETRDLIPRLTRLQDAVRKTTIPPTPHHTNPGKGEFKREFLPDLLRIYDGRYPHEDFAHVSDATSKDEKVVGRTKDEAAFITVGVKVVVAQIVMRLCRSQSAHWITVVGCSAG